MIRVANIDPWVKRVFILIQVVGFAGILSNQWHELTLSLTPINLLFVSIVLLWFHRGWQRAEIGWMVATFAVGFGIEVLGVHTGLVFGNYRYGDTLGLKVFQVPLAMGLNWFIMCYVSTRLAVYFGFVKWKGALVSAALMVGIDLIMEPVAMALDFWQWDKGHIPFQNYLAWFGVSFGLNYWWFELANKGLNNFSLWVLTYLVFFFAVMHIAFAA